MEIERKWMVNGWPEGLPLEEEFTMRQGYISVQPTVRIREEALTGGSTDYILCFKSAGGLAREEIERSIDKDLLCSWRKKSSVTLIKKVRRSYRLPDGAVLEVNHVDEGLPTASGTPRWSTPRWKPRSAGSLRPAALWRTSTMK